MFRVGCRNYLVPVQMSEIINEYINKYVCVFVSFYHVTFNELTFFLFLQIVLRGTILTTNATVAVDDISIAGECVIVNGSLPEVSQESKGKFHGFQYIFPNVCYI